MENSPNLDGKKDLQRATVANDPLAVMISAWHNYRQTSTVARLEAGKATLAYQESEGFESLSAALDALMPMEISLRAMRYAVDHYRTARVFGLIGAKSLTFRWLELFSRLLDGDELRAITVQVGEKFEPLEGPAKAMWRRACIHNLSWTTAKSIIDGWLGPRSEIVDPAEQQTRLIESTVRAIGKAAEVDPSSVETIVRRSLLLVDGDERKRIVGEMYQDAMRPEPEQGTE